MPLCILMHLVNKMAVEGDIAVYISGTVLCLIALFFFFLTAAHNIRARKPVNPVYPLSKKYLQYI